MLARLEVRVAGLPVSFTTRNTLEVPTRIGLQLVDGPFTALEGAWRFHSLAEDACKVSLDLDFEVAGKLVGGALAVAFGSLGDRMAYDRVIPIVQATADLLGEALNPESAAP